MKSTFRILSMQCFVIHLVHMTNLPKYLTVMSPKCSKFDDAIERNDNKPLSVKIDRL
jgi:hypothetical protein